MTSYISIIILILTSVCVELVLGLALPKYMKRCGRANPDFDECVLKSAKSAVKKFSLGDPERNVPPLDPLYIPELTVLGQKNGKGLNMVLQNVKLHGCGDMDVTKYKLDFVKNKFWGKVRGDLRMESNYNLTGTLISIPLYGVGDSSSKLTDVRINYNMDFDVVKRENGKEYVVITNDYLKYDVGHAEFKLNNLFNNTVLGESTNRVLNEFWQDVMLEMGPPVAAKMKISFKSAFQKFFDSASMDEMYIN